MFRRDEVARRAVRVKICGVTNPSDAWAAIEAGADALGFNCYRGSKRYIDITAAGEWLTELPGTVTKVAVMVNPSWHEAIAIAGLQYIDALQLHGAETPEFCRRLSADGVIFGKALPVENAGSLRAATSFSTETLVLDSAAAAGAFGGSGHTFPWEIAQDFTSAHPDLRVVLAGGLNPQNVAAAIRQVRPYGVDVTSGIEAAAGRKDHELLRAFIRSARAA